MARPKAAKPEPKAKDATKDLLVRVRRRFKAMTEADSDNRQKALEDLKFLHVPGSQWDQNQVKERGERPCYEFNKLRITVKRVINHIRANRPQVKVRAVEDGDKDTADILDGLIRNIANTSDMDTVVDYAAEYQVGGGMGAWRVETYYSENSVYDQDIRVCPIKNPFCLYADPSASDPIKRDAEDWILTEKISKTSYKSRWPDAKAVDFDDVEFDDDEDWNESDEDGMVRICEYWYKEQATKLLCLLSDGSTIDKAKTPALPEGVTIVKEREVRCPKIMMCIVSGDAMLEPPTEWAGSMFPFVQIYGEWMVIDGKVYWHGLTRFSKDAQRAYNIGRTSIEEKVAGAPDSKYWATAEQAKGHTKEWGEAHRKKFPFLLYNADPKAPGPPQMMAPDPIPLALIQQVQMASEDIKSTSGIFDPSLGQQSNETSGRAIRARQEQGEIATYNFPDNAAKGIRRTGEILIDLIPKVYDRERSVRILGVDGAEKYEKINAHVFDPATGQTQTVNDLSRGRYDVTVTVGPTFATQRQEATEVYTEIARAVPQLWQVAGDLIARSMDLPYSDKIAERMQLLLPPQVQQSISEGKPVPPEVQQVMQQAEQAMAVVQQQSQLVQAAAQEVEASKAESEKAKADVQTAIANLKTEEARFEARVAQELAKLAQKEAQMSAKGAEGESTQDRAALQSEVTQAVAEIREMAAQFMQQASQTLAEIMAKQAPQVIIPNRPRVSRVVRQNGALIPIYEDQEAQA